MCRQSFVGSWKNSAEAMRLTHTVNSRNSRKVAKPKGRVHER